MKLNIAQQTHLVSKNIYLKLFKNHIRKTRRYPLSSYITFRSCKQLDGKHTIFGKLVGGMDTLTTMEQIEVDNKDRPIHDIVIEVAQVFVDPYAEAEELVINILDCLYPNVVYIEKHEFDF